MLLSLFFREMDSTFYDEYNISQILLEMLMQNQNISNEALIAHAQLLYKQLTFQRDLSSYTEFRLHKAMLLYVPPILLVLGMIGNVLSFFILRHKTMTRQSTTLFLAVLSIADSLVLFIGLFRKWIGEITGLDIQHESMFLCKTITVLGYSISHYSVWLIVAVTIERFIVVCRPLQASRYCKLKRARKVVLVMIFIFLAINAHLFWTVELTEQSMNRKTVLRCDAGPKFVEFIDRVWPWIDLVLYSLFPLVILLFFNTHIIRQVVRATAGRDILQNGPLMKVDARRNTKDANLKLTIMLLTISFTFLATTVPMNVVMIASVVWRNEMDNPKQSAKLVLIRTISELLMYLNHSINFFLYCATGQKFRNIVLRMICGRSTSNISNFSDHSQHLYCSRANNNCNGHKSENETAF